MPADSLRLGGLDDLRQYVQETLCRFNELQMGAFQITERVLVRGAKPCGVYFCLHGPRSVKLTAIWETDGNTILFYGSDGRRQHKTRLLQGPKLAPAAA